MWYLSLHSSLEVKGCQENVNLMQAGVWNRNLHKTKHVCHSLGKNFQCTNTRAHTPFYTLQCVTKLAVKLWNVREASYAFISLQQALNTHALLQDYAFSTVAMLWKRSSRKSHSQERITVNRRPEHCKYGQTYTEGRMFRRLTQWRNYVNVSFLYFLPAGL